MDGIILLKLKTHDKNFGKNKKIGNEIKLKTTNHFLIYTELKF